MLCAVMTVLCLMGVFRYTFQTQKSDLFINALALCMEWTRKYVFIPQLDYVVWSLWLVEIWRQSILRGSRHMGDVQNNL